MKLIIGLGNPGIKYNKTRHNIGFMAVDLLALEHNLKFKFEANLEGFIAEGFINGNKVIILKPSTYMNLSGNSVVKTINYFKVDLNNVVVIYDDANLEVGQLRLRLSGSAGGQKGIQNIISCLHTNEIKRIRIGISSSDDLINHVLSKFSRKEKKDIDVSLQQAVEALNLFINNTPFENIMNQFN